MNYMTTDELRRMPDNDCIIFEKGLKPIKAKKFWYFETPMLKELNKVKFYRSSRAVVTDDQGNPVLDANGNYQYKEAEKVLFAEGSVSGNTFNVTLKNQEGGKSDFPVGESDGNVAGYHENSTLSFGFTTNASTGYVSFNANSPCKFWDNFTVDVSKNVHPLQYLYKMEVGVIEDGDDYAYSNEVRVPVYKTDTKINSYSKSEVDNDNSNVSSIEVSNDVLFDEKVQLSSKGDILRYDAYRWKEKTSDDDCYYIIDAVGIVPEKDPVNPTESDIAPTGMAGNQGEWYTVSMNDSEGPQEYYYSTTDEEAPHVSTDHPTTWATFVDYYPRLQTKEAKAQSYVYAPVVELFTKGYKENKVNGKDVKRTDYNTYGGPMQYTAVGEFFIDPENITYHMSPYSWPGDRSLPQYSYYNVFMQFDKAAVPAGYELYKVRAWRQADDQYLGEQEPDDATLDYSYRKGEKISGTNTWSYLFDEITYGKDEVCTIGDGTTTNPPRIFDYVIGEKNAVINNTEVPNVWKYTFGARRVGLGVKGEEGWDNIAELPIKFIVRAYFTKKINLTSKAGGDDKYYIVEQKIDYTIKRENNIITGVNDVVLNKGVVDVIYYNTVGMSSNEPFDGINIVVTRYNDGSTSTTKVLK